MDSHSKLEHDGQAPAHRPLEDAPELRKVDEFDAPNEGEIKRFTPALGEDHATARQMKLPGLDPSPPANKKAD